VAFARRILLNHSTECFFYGDVDLGRAEELSAIVLNERTKYLGSILQNSISAENFSDKFPSSNFGIISNQKTTYLT
jgi:hypothetical protein